MVTTRREALMVPLYFVLASVMLHVQTSVGVTVFAKVRERMTERATAGARQRTQRLSEPVEITFAPITPVPSTPTMSLPAAPTVATTPPPPQRPRVRRRRPEEEDPEPERRPDPPQIPQEVVRAQPNPASLQHVDQARANDTMPTDPAFLAQSSNDVREQTVARVRSQTQDDPNPQASGRSAARQAGGNATSDVSAQQRDHEGDPDRFSGAGASAASRPTTSGSGAMATHEAISATRGGAAGTQGAAGESRPTIEGSQPMEGAVISLGPAPQQGSSGEQGQGGAEGDAATRARQAQAAARLGVAGMGAERTLAALTPTSTEYARAFGAQADRERAEARERRSQARGTSPAEEWNQTRAAVENYVASVRVGNQTSLRTAASPFSAYLTAMHRRIHHLFADGFLEGVAGAPPDSPLNDPSLHTTIEIILERDGRIFRVGVARSSGSMPFDVASLNSVRRSAPFGNAPDAIVSPDGHVYVHWGFYRNERQCGTFNAEPYMMGAATAGAPGGRTTVMVPHTGTDRL